jgi:hypothetical protein
MNTESEQDPESTIVTDVDEDTFERFREKQQREVDRISLELLSNTKHYKKYIAKNRPEEQLKHIDDSRRFLKYKSRVAALFIELLEQYENDGEDESDTSVGIELQSMFRELVQKTIQHLEWSENNHSAKSAGEFEDEDMMFAHTGFKPHNVRKKRHSVDEDPYSFWGATIRKSEST